MEAIPVLEAEAPRWEGAALVLLGASYEALGRKAEGPRSGRAEVVWESERRGAALRWGRRVRPRQPRRGSVRLAVETAWRGRGPMARCDPRRGSVRGVGARGCSAVARTAG